jgi:uncharacterized SAM-binding protein YcdF (DUF218 family)
MAEFTGRALFVGLLVAAITTAGGYWLFQRQVDHLSAQLPADAIADGIVVLTGDRDRIETAVRLLEQRKGRRLLISGVHPLTSASAIGRKVPAARELFECCIDIDKAALDTVGNAQETAKWARANGFSSLIVVTSDYHMPRSLTLIRAALPEAQILPHAVRSAKAEAQRAHFGEFLKYVSARLGLPIDGSHFAVLAAN